MARTAGARPARRQRVRRRRRLALRPHRRRPRIDVRPRRRHRIVRCRRGFLAEGYRPEPDSIRPEEWINAFDYGDPPATGDGLALGVEGAFLVDAEPDVADACASACRRESSTRSSARRRTSRSSSTRRVRWTSAIASASCSRRSRCWYATCVPTTRSPSSPTATRRLVVARPDTGRRVARRSSRPSTRSRPTAAPTWRRACCLGYEQASEFVRPRRRERRGAGVRRRRQPGRHRPRGAHPADHPGRRRRHPPRDRRLRDGQLQRPPDGAARRPGRRLLLLRRRLRRGRAAVRRRAHADAHRRRRAGQGAGGVRSRRRRPTTA